MNSGRDEACTLSVIIVNWNGARWLRACLSSLQRQVLTEPWEILVVDNGSTDESRAIVQAFPQVRWLPQAKNRGFARGNNRGAQEAQGEFLLLLNNDTEMEPGALAAGLQFLQTHPDCAAVNGIAFIADGRERRIQNAGIWLDAALWGRDRGAVIRPGEQGYESMQTWYEHARPLDAVCGVALMCRAEAYRQVGGFPEPFFAYYEDVALSLAWKQRGWELWFVPQLRLVHHHSATTGRGEQQLFYAERNHLLLTGMFGSPTLLVTTMGTALARFLKSSLLLGRHPGAPALRRWRTRATVLLSAMRWLPWSLTYRWRYTL